MIDGLCCNFQPCDAVDVQEAAAQEKEEPTTHELVDDNKGTYYSALNIFIRRCIAYVSNLVACCVLRITFMTLL